ANVLTGTFGASADSFQGTPQVTAVTQGANGTVTVSAGGNVTYTPDANFNGVDSFTYTVTSPAGITATATVTVTGSPVDDATTITKPGPQAIQEDTPLLFTGVRQISVADADGDVSSVELSVASGVLNLTLAGTAGVSAGAIGSTTVTISGSQVDINATL